MTTKQLDALALAEDFADWQEAKGRDHPATRETHQKLEAELRRLHELNEDLYQQGVGFIARIEKDEALLRRALTYLEYASQQLPMIHASIVDPVIDELKERLK